MKNYCNEGIKSLAIIKTLQTKLGQELVSLNSASERSEKIVTLKEIYQIRKNVIKEIYFLESLYFLVERLKLREQYDSQVKILKDSGILRNLGETKNPPKEEYGIIGVDDKEYTVPTYEDVLSRLKDPEKRELILKKVKQGFVKLQIVPFATNISRIIECYKQVLLKTHQESGIKATDGSVLKLSEYFLDFLLDDEAGINILKSWCDNPKTPQDKQIEYGIKNYVGETKDERGGYYKSEALKNPSSAWRITLIEDLPDLPVQNEGKTVSNRRQIVAGKTGAQYLRDFENQIQYQEEFGQSPEEALITWITYLMENGIVIDRYDDKKRSGRVNMLVGHYLPDFDHSTITAYWLNNHSHPVIFKIKLDGHSDFASCRSSVNI